MFTKLVLASCIFAIVFGYSYIPPAQWQPAKEEPANYEFQYEVHDLNTWDIKRQKEKADNGKIHGEYSLVEPDGLHRRVVTYTADDEHGFIADVRLEPWKGEQRPQQAPKPIQNHYIPPAPAAVYGPPKW